MSPVDAFTQQRIPCGMRVRSKLAFSGGDGENLLLRLGSHSEKVTVPFSRLPIRADDS